MEYLQSLNEGLQAQVSALPVAPLVERLLTREPPPLVPTAPCDAALVQEILAIHPEALFPPGKVRRPEFAVAAKSGLLLWCDALVASHSLSQGIETDTGSYWHGIMHRREPDYGNAKYWFRRVPSHTLYGGVREAAVEIAAGFASPTILTLLNAIEADTHWDPARFVDWCEAAAAPDADLDTVRYLELVQLAEIELLMAWCFRKAQ